MTSAFTKTLLLCLAVALILQVSAILLIQTWAQPYLADAALNGTYSTASIIVSAITFSVQDAIILGTVAWLIVSASRKQTLQITS